MKTAILLLLGLALVAAFSPKYPEYGVGDKVFLERQKDILKLFKFVKQQSYYPEYASISEKYPLENEQLYMKPEVVKEFSKLYYKGFLPKGEIFSIYYQPQRVQAIALYKLFFYAKDFDAFYKTAIYARQHLNEYMFVYSLNAAILHRSDIKGIIVPPIYEVFPHFFFNTDVLEEAYKYKQAYSQHLAPKEGYVIYANYSGKYLNLNKEQSYLSYFTEDIGVNAFYYYYNLMYPFWLDVADTTNPNIQKRTILYNTVNSQLLAKYYLERYSQDLGSIPELDLEHSTGFYPLLQYQNGLDFPVRPDGVKLKGPYYYNIEYLPSHVNYTYAYKFFQDSVRRIKDAIDLGYVITRQGEYVPLEGDKGYEMLLDMLQGNPKSPNLRYYGSIPRYLKYLLGYSYNLPLNDYQIRPSALEQTETALRDPMFYQLYKYLAEYIQYYLNYLPSYNYNDLLLKGIEIKDFEIDRLTTYFDYYYSDITNALYVNQKEFLDENFAVQVRQERLNHKPFTFKVKVESSEIQDVEVKVFIGPKFNPKYNISFSNYRSSFALLDIFDYKLKLGENIIVRDSRESTLYFPDRTSYKDLYYSVMNQGKFKFDTGDINIGLPNRFMLPKGASYGKEYQLYIYIGPTHPKALLPVMYPFDRNAEYSAYKVPNAYLKDVLIYFKHVKQLNVTY